MTRDEYLQRLRRHAPLEVSFGPRSVALFDPVFLDSEQGKFGGGDWVESWYVIGLDTSDGEAAPIFIDREDPQTPVYTGSYVADENYWFYDTATESVDGFFAGLVAFAKIAEGPYPPSAGDRAAYLAVVQAANPGLETWFWEYLVTPPPSEPVWDNG
jgi:hypothetical protein